MSASDWKTYARRSISTCVILMWVEDLGIMKCSDQTVISW